MFFQCSVCVLEIWEDFKKHQALIVILIAYSLNEEK